LVIGRASPPAGRKLFPYFLIVTDAAPLDKQILGGISDNLPKFGAKAMRRTPSDRPVAGRSFTMLSKK
jgi:hypothetical protein